MSFKDIRTISATVTVFSICTGNITLGHCTVLRPRVIFPVQIEKTVIVVLIMTETFKVKVNAYKFKKNFLAVYSRKKKAAKFGTETAT